MVSSNIVGYTDQFYNGHKYTYRVVGSNTLGMVYKELIKIDDRSV